MTEISGDRLMQHLGYVVGEQDLPSSILIRISFYVFCTVCDERYPGEGSVLFGRAAAANFFRARYIFVGIGTASMLRLFLTNFQCAPSPIHHQTHNITST
jgi:hypothetical protein